MTDSSSRSGGGGSGEGGLRVIGAGLGRTGTFSQKAALELLLGGRCYHGYDLDRKLNDMRPWRRVLEDGMTKQHAEEIFKDCVACVDIPSRVFYRELMEIYPEAKVVLSLRDPHRWVASMRITICEIYYKIDHAPWLMKLVRRLNFDDAPECDLPLRTWPRFEDYSDSELAAWYERHNESVRRHVPKHRLLEFRVSDGWQPLCEFLGVPVPDEPFPRCNDKKEFDEKMRYVDRSILFYSYAQGILFCFGVTALAWAANLV